VAGADAGTTLTGDGGGNALVGTVNSDTLIGLAGNDTLTGGAGADRFVFNTALNAGTNVDTITDFSSGTDRILLDHLILTALTTGNLAAASFVAEAGATAHDGNDYLLYDTTTGDLSYDADGTGAQAAVLFANLTGHPPWWRRIWRWCRAWRCHGGDQHTDYDCRRIDYAELFR
jgi:Ca2+-binding RTX toxin-like protein